jgi:predicted small secreted protein|tara:strand:+ start:131 stop:271 length:141 start_codon:yes stop_codon:yes gene_type:complete
MKYIMLMSLFVFLSACGNTMVGFGKDIQTMGENIMKEEPKEKTVEQ